MTAIERDRLPTLPPDFSISLIAAHYNEEAGNYPDEGEPKLMQEFLQLISNSGFIADLGCGPGYRVRDLSLQGRRAIGLDISPAMIVRAKAENPDIANFFFVGDMNNLKDYFHEKSLKGITAFYSAIHLAKKDSLAFFIDCWDLLEDDGYMYIIMQEAFIPGQNKEVHSHNANEQKGVAMNVVSYEEQEDTVDQAGFDIVSTFVRDPDLEAGEHPYRKRHCILKKRSKKVLPE